MPMRCLALVATMLLCAAWIAPAQAHPHVLIDVKVEVVFDEDGQVAGLRETWIFDELYTAFAIGGLDGDGDGQADEDKLAELLASNLANLREYDYFTRVELGDNKLVIGDAGDATSWVERGRLRMTFLVPFEEPIALAAGSLRYAVYDPTYYVELLHAPSSDAIALSGAPGGCDYALQAPNPNPETTSFAASLDQTETAGDGLGIHFAEWVSVRCD